MHFLLVAKITHIEIQVLLWPWHIDGLIKLVITLFQVLTLINICVIKVIALLLTKSCKI